MNPDVDVTSRDILDSMQLEATVHIRKRVLLVVRVRLWCATQIIRLAGLVGGFAIVVHDDGEDATDG